MNISLLRFKRALHTALFVLLLSVAGMDKMYAYDFSAVCPSGQTLYYNIIDSVNHYVEVVFSGSDQSTGNIGGPFGYEPYWYSLFYDIEWDDPQPSGDVVLPETVEYDNETFTLISIGEAAFSNCSALTSVTIPNSVTSIGNAAFCECIGLTSIALPDSLVSIGSSVFVRCTSLESIEIPNAVTSLGDYAFSFSGIKHLEIPNSVTTIGEELCAACEDLISVVLPSTVTFIKSHAFVWCGSLNELIVFAETPPALGFDVFFDHGGFYKSSKGTVNVYVPCGFEDTYASLSWGEFNNFYGMCGGTVTVVVDPEEGGTVAGGGTIEENSFCTVTAIANEGYIFEHWELNDGTIVSNTAEYTFVVYNDIELVAHFISDDNIVFADANVKSICINHWDSNNDGELSYAEAASITDLGSYFQYNSQITSFNELQYFTGLSSIGDAAFKNCTKLSSVVLPNSLTSIGDEAFCYCSKLKGSLSFPNFLTSIGDSAFNECSRLTGSLTFPNFLTSIGNYAFYGCGRLTSLTIPNSVTSIGNYAFSGCSGLTSMTVLAEIPPTLGYSPFGGVNKSIPVYVPCGSAEAYQSAAYWNEFTNIQEVCSQQTIALAQGWNWVSFNVEITMDDLKAAIAAVAPTGDNPIIKSQNNGQTQKRGNNWMGPLTQLDLSQMYEIQIGAACEITLEGMPVDPDDHPVTIVYGANWIAFPLSESMTVANAFSNFTPTANDEVSSQNNGKTIRHGSNWMGSLTDLIPGRGYIYNSKATQNKTLVFPMPTKK